MTKKSKTDKKSSPGNSSSPTTVTSKETKSSASGGSKSTAKPGFEDDGYENGNLSVGNSKCPANLADWQRKLDMTRDSPPAEEVEYEWYRSKIQKSQNE
jgi:hypothetical protein